MSRMRKHVIFVIDGSRSMNKRDALDCDGDYQSRLDAVLDACFEFIEMIGSYAIGHYPKSNIPLGPALEGSRLPRWVKPRNGPIVSILNSYLGGGLHLLRGGVNLEVRVYFYGYNNCPQDQRQDSWSSPLDRYSFVSFNDVAKVHFRAKHMGGRYLYGLRRAEFGPKFWTKNVGLGSRFEQMILDPFYKLPAFYLGRFHRSKLTSRRKSGEHVTRAPSIPGRPETLSGAMSKISSTVSFMATMGLRMRRGLTLENVEEAEWNNTDEGHFYCDKLELEGGSFLVKQRDLVARLRHRPFSVAGMRYCFRMWDMGALGKSQQLINLVGKRTK